MEDSILISICQGGKNAALPPRHRLCSFRTRTPTTTLLTPRAPAPVENGNQISNGSLEDESHSKSNSSSSSSLHRHMDSHHTQGSSQLFSVRCGGRPLKQRGAGGLGGGGSLEALFTCRDVLFQRLRLSNGNESTTLGELLRWRRAQCEGRGDWKHRPPQSPPLPPTLLWTNRKASP
ncbi:hypothetical protein D5F01_LYC01593 [Larimichthys crocea]|uniref:Uncharacterized protein n=1 Tax=Larimichthys crocea TaxID=215358 RepID=A0A6G0J6N5_LARCR|nr:hypothetical protein D5F01_LYC01593 [Larimichthys crocea]